MVTNNAWNSQNPAQVARGGTGAATLTGVVLGNGTSAMTGLTYVPVTSWTPNLQINGSSTGITYTTQLGQYSRIDNIVYFWLQIVLSNKGADTGAITVSNFPVTLGANGDKQWVPCGTGLISASTYTVLALNGGANSTVLTVYATSFTSAAQGALNSAGITNTFNIECSGMFIIG